MGKNKEGDFQGKSLGRDRVNLLGKAGGHLTECGFNAFTKVLYQKALCEMMRPFAVLAARTLLLTAAGLVEEVFGYIIRIAGIGVEDTAGGQVQR
ncbi:hypothetical protein E4631_19530 [Hymenobacter sp. UV11]|uniref:hypothetical protein n=1 Tax=Hymenobacter sp. UV11 TaxID=1849735 RepID=UPI001060CE5D|nr:hypothetical protein [Hymenobacter sp. UV11]TFZ64197.1 hypothetical protein E4631_19530 [Hymenobacter sp. UV11]